VESFVPHLQRPTSINANSRRALQVKQRRRFFCTGRDGELSRLVLVLPPAVGVPHSSDPSSCLTTDTHICLKWTAKGLWMVSNVPHKCTAQYNQSSYKNNIKHHTKYVTCPYTHTHPFIGPLSETTQVSQYQKGKTNPDFTEARDSEWQWHQLGHVQVSTSLQTDNHASNAPLITYPY